MAGATSPGSMPLLPMMKVGSGLSPVVAPTRDPHPATRRKATSGAMRSGSDRVGRFGSMHELLDGVAQSVTPQTPELLRVTEPAHPAEYSVRRHTCARTVLSTHHHQPNTESEICGPPHH